MRTFIWEVEEHTIPRSIIEHAPKRLLGIFPDNAIMREHSHELFVHLVLDIPICMDRR